MVFLLGFYSSFFMLRNSEHLKAWLDDFILLFIIQWLFIILRINSQRRQWHPTPVLLPGKSHGQRSLLGCSPWGREESDTTEQPHFQFSLSCIGEGNGNPLQCSHLENHRHQGAWWAAVYGVAQSQTRLKQLSSSSRINATSLTIPFQTFQELVLVHLFSLLWYHCPILTILAATQAFLVLLLLKFKLPSKLGPLHWLTPLLGRSSPRELGLVFIKVSDSIILFFFIVFIATGKSYISCLHVFCFPH